MQNENLLDIKNYSLSFILQNEKITALDNVSVSIKKNEIIGIVGESGSGKSSLGISILKLFENSRVQTSGQIYFENEDVLTFEANKLNSFRGKDVSMIFQEPMSSLNPVMKIGKQVSEALLIHKICSEKEAKEKTVNLLSEVGIKNAKERYESYPHELSGGMRQRVMIAMAVITHPKLLIADEVTTSLDITVSRQILSLIKRIQKENKISVMFISHDLSVIESIADKIAVMYLGNIVELNEKESLVQNPLHPYSKALFEISHCIREKDSAKKLPVIKGEVPSPNNKPKGCSFHPRCKECMDICKEKEPETFCVGNAKVACHLYKK